MRHRLDVPQHTHLLPDAALRLGGPWACVSCGTILELPKPAEAPA